MIADSLRLPALLSGTTLHLGVVLAGALALLVWVVQRQTTLGFEIQAAGLNPIAARLAGIPVASRQILVMAVSGGCAGLAGAVQQAGVTGFMSGSSTSYGYAGIAVALLGRLHPLGVAAAAVFFGMLDTGARNLEKKLAIPHDLGDVVKGLIVLAVLVGVALAARRRPVAVAAEGGHDGAQ
jgi:simple sugar transport system permease protein